MLKNLPVLPVMVNIASENNFNDGNFNLYMFQSNARAWENFCKIYTEIKEKFTNFIQTAETKNILYSSCQNILL